MTAVSFYSVTVSADALSALCRLVRQFDAPGWYPRAFAASRRCDEFSDVENAFAEALHFGVTGPSVVRSGAADSEVAPQRSALVALLPVALSCLVLSQAARAGCDFHPRPGDRVLLARALRATSAKRAPRGRRPNVEGGD